ncbi:hypothetical protein K493DRAFT_311208 [Basidiobolus meristosporus CBS 931.73]|uniref:Histone deacetylase interacting domain-containing protein n=1 Tax=Basidiobolus meristosporus CBS 931.73 TaxID=1314790 RepID=A0A1Y1Z3H1_9FUNG|nr:hypothetical protein K493DRAFT_311208 [Basidiobolus meristosporus CBS 931.73]|eukprot:ORY04818.1 hypothetical protein K493DRAFT_311208 [Basidiobolus meristosporus CBS 931.73]
MSVSMMAPPQPIAPSPASIPHTGLSGPMSNSMSPNHLEHQRPPPPAQSPPQTANRSRAPSAQPPSQPGSAEYRPLNVRDALSYLDQVKIQFHDQPDVYNRFLDIMKDFKSQAIDTPGVIDRVSNLFRGHPTLISGFNTFLPPGYRIEISPNAHDPHNVRVTTPNGTINSSGMPEPNQAPHPPPAASNTNPSMPPVAGPHYYPPPAVGTFTHGGPPPQSIASGPHPSAGGQLPPQPPVGGYHVPPMAQHMSHGANGPQGPATGPPLSNGPGSNIGLQGQGAVGSRRPPVEFNHAINYVNKIKNRFSSEPETYKQFLEILQTYQKEQKPIQEVYAQVQVLFRNATDLLGEFKQFLPDNSANAQGGPSSILPMPGNPSVLSVQNNSSIPLSQQPGVTQQPQRMMPIMPPSIQGMGPGPRLPPVGNFGPTNPVPAASEPFPQQPVSTMSPPPSANPGVPGGGHAVPVTASPTHATVPIPNKKRKGANVASEKVTGATGSAKAKRAKHAAQKMNLESSPGPAGIASPSATMPTQLPTKPPASSEELSFFDRVKKYLSNKQTYNEFLKVLNLFSQEILDQAMLVQRVESYIGGNKELFEWFKSFVGYEPKNEHIVENLPAPRPRVDLLRCKGHGPSYRLLPKADTKVKCSGRDLHCEEVLNNEWVSHPTWASEESGFVAHKKNQYEEQLHKCEEERYEYDLNIEANLSTIGLLEPIARKIQNMTPDEKSKYKLPPGLGGPSLCIYKRMINKIYGKEQGAAVIDAVHNSPAIAVPVVLKRLKQKDEEWRRARREWNRVWREVDVKNFYKALDYQNVSFKSNDRKLITPKYLTTEIETIKREQRDRYPPDVRPAYQFEFQFDDPEVFRDITRILFSSLGKQGGFSNSDKECIESFIKDFIREFFGLEKIEHERIEDNDDASSVHTDDTDNESRASEDEDSMSSQQDSDEQKEREKETLANGVEKSTPPESMDTDSEGAHADNEESITSAASSPQARSVEDNTADNKVDAKETDSGLAKPSTPSKDESRQPATWIQIKTPKIEPRRKTSFNFYGSNVFYVFFRLYQLLYSRVESVKDKADKVPRKVPHSETKSVAGSLSLRHRVAVLGDMDYANADYYQEFLDLVDRLFDGEIDQQAYEEGMRYLFGIHAYVVFTIDKLIQTIVLEPKCKDLIDLFTKENHSDTTSFRQQMMYRSKAENVIDSEESLYRIECVHSKNTVMIQLLNREDTVLDSAVSLEEKWSMYIDSYVLLTPTKDVVQPENKPFLVRNRPSNLPEELPQDAIMHSGLELKICVNTLKTYFVANTEDYFQRRRKPVSESDLENTKRKKHQKWRKWLDGDLGWSRGKPRDELEKKCEQWFTGKSLDLKDLTTVKEDVKTQSLEYRIFETPKQDPASSNSNPEAAEERNQA